MSEKTNQSAQTRIYIRRQALKHVVTSCESLQYDISSDLVQQKKTHHVI